MEPAQPGTDEGIYKLLEVSTVASKVKSALKIAEWSSSNNSVQRERIFTNKRFYRYGHNGATGPRWGILRVFNIGLIDPFNFT